LATPTSTWRGLSKSSYTSSGQPGPMSIGCCKNFDNGFRCCLALTWFWLAVTVSFLSSRRCAADLYPSDCHVNGVAPAPVTKHTSRLVMFSPPAWPRPATPEVQAVASCARSSTTAPACPCKSRSYTCTHTHARRARVFAHSCGQWQRWAKKDTNLESKKVQKLADVSLRPPAGGRLGGGVWGEDTISRSISRSITVLGFAEWALGYFFARTSPWNRSTLVPSERSSWCSPNSSRTKRWPVSGAMPTMATCEPSASLSLSFCSLCSQSA